MDASLLHDLIEMERGPAVPILGKAPRAMFVAGKGMRLIGGDFSNIEGRINSWINGEQWELDAFKAYDRKEGPDLYYLAYSKAFNVPVAEVTKYQRDEIGKKMVLACGYQGSVGAWLRFVTDQTAVTKIAKEKFYDSEQWRKAADQYDFARFHNDLSSDQWIAIKIVVNSWRDSHPQIVQGWWNLQDAAIEAVACSGEVIPVCEGRVQYLAAEGFLWCRIPSGKVLAYAKPRLVETRDEWLVDADGEMFPAEEFTEDEIAERVQNGATLQRSNRVRTQVAFEGRNQKTKAWGTQRLYGGLQCNNVVQSTARELLRIAMHTVESFDYPVVLHVHDELVAEVSQEFGSVKEFESLMSILPPWLQGLPLAAKAWTDTRYVK